MDDAVLMRAFCLGVAVREGEGDFLVSFKTLRRDILGTDSLCCCFGFAGEA